MVLTIGRGPSEEACFHRSTVSLDGLGGSGAACWSGDRLRAAVWLNNWNLTPSFGTIRHKQNMLKMKLRTGGSNPQIISYICHWRLGKRSEIWLCQDSSMELSPFQIQLSNVSEFHTLWTTKRKQQRQWQWQIHLENTFKWPPPSS